MKKFILMLPVLALTLSVPVKASVKVIYGADDRKEVYQETNPMLLELARSTAAMISTSSVRVNNRGEVSFNAQTFGSRGFCSTERFHDQLAPANCSGFLVGEDLLVTAGHCVTSESSCKSYSWVFNFHMEAEGTYAPVTQNEVYNCKELIKTDVNRSTGTDYAVVRLDRKVVDRAPLQIRTEGAPKVGDALTVIGHPAGLPTKIAGGANIRSIKGAYFVANLDTYGGNSGSAVFNTETGLVEGILVRGETDYLYDGRRGCRISNVVPNNGGRGEDVTLISEVLAYLD
jgi:V8-like Glu-specific endopeptidase